MSNDATKKITHNQYLAALGLAVAARAHYARARELELELGAILGTYDPNGLVIIPSDWIGDLVYQDEREMKPADFDSVLERSGITVEASLADEGPDHEQ